MSFDNIKIIFKTILISICILSVLSSNLKINDLQSGKDDKYLSFEDIVINRGYFYLLKFSYNVETHFVTTKDGYILKAFRIPGKRTNETRTDSNISQIYFNKVALLWHGITDSSDAYVIADNSRSIPFHLVDIGYDVVCLFLKF